MQLSADMCYRAIQTRDARFDGKFFTAVRTTGIYCRPTCPAPTPKPENCQFFSHAAAAQEAGFRPCLRCRPELAPDLYNAQSSAALVSRALGYISAGSFDDQPLNALASQLGVTDRHLRRLFKEHIGASPVTVAQTKRILFAKKLIDETDLPLIEVALAAGFKSLRRFNTVMQQTYQRAPRDLRSARKHPPRHTASSAITLKLPFSPPYHWDSLISALKLDAIPGVEAVNDGIYRRTIAIEASRGVVEVRQVVGENYLSATIWFPNVALLGQIVDRLHRLFDLGASPTEIAAHLQTNEHLSPLVTRWPWLRVPGAWDDFEVAVRVMLGQQVSVSAANTLAGRLVMAYGELLPDAYTSIAPDHVNSVQRTFPSPAVLAAADLSTIGLPKKRALAISALAALLIEQPRFLRSFKDPDAAIVGLCALPGIGPWTANMITMRVLHDPDAFPATDLVLRRALERLAASMNGRSTALEIAETWRPWRAYATAYLWMAASDVPAPLLSP